MSTSSTSKQLKTFQKRAESLLMDLATFQHLFKEVTGSNSEMFTHISLKASRLLGEACVYVDFINKLEKEADKLQETK